MDGSVSYAGIPFGARFGTGVVPSRPDRLRRRSVQVGEIGAWTTEIAPHTASTISQLSYVVLGAVLASAWGTVGAALHIVMHAFGKITLFFCAGAVLVTAHKTEVSELGGLGRRMPVTMGAFVVASLCIIGLPPLGGAWSKWYLVTGAVDAGEWVLLGVLLVSSLLSVAYLLTVPLRAFSSAAGEGSDGSASQIHEAPMPCLVAIVVTASGCLALFVYPDPFFDLVNQVAGVR